MSDTQAQDRKKLTKILFNPKIPSEKKKLAMRLYRKKYWPKQEVTVPEPVLDPVEIFDGKLPGLN